MNQSFLDRKNITYELKKFGFLQNKFCCLFSPILSLFGHNFCSQAPIEKKLYSHKAYQFFYLHKKIQKIITKI